MIKKADIIDRKALVAKLEELAGWSGYSSKTQPQVLGLFRDALEQGRSVIRDRFENKAAPGSDVVKANTVLTDQIIRTMYEFAIRHVYPVANPTKGEQIALIAAGGYGRAEMAPESDVDLMFLLPYKQTPHGEQVAEYMLYTLWDLKLKVGHSTRNIDDCVRLAKDDLTILTNLLDSRMLWGDEELFNAYRARFDKDVVGPMSSAFVEAKLNERSERLIRTGDSRYFLEPNVKEGKGGLRDLQTLFWLAKFLYGVGTAAGMEKAGFFSPADVRRFRKARNFLWTVRCHLHYLTGRPEERLTFNVQEPISQRMGYTDHAGARGVERFMKHYFLVAKDVGDLTRIICSVLEERQKKSIRRRRLRIPGFPFGGNRSIEGFRVDRGRVNVTDPKDFERDPVKLLRLFRIGQREDMDIHPDALRLVTQSLRLIDNKLRADPEANRLFMEMLCDPNGPERTLRHLNEAGVFGRFIPDFGRVVGQMQYDMYHVYTVDEHTIRAIGFLHGIESGALCDMHPLACEVIGELKSRRALYVAMLLHDVAKGRGGDHSEIGAAIAKHMGPRLGLDQWETDTVSWLIRHHLQMSRVAFKRDIDDPKTLSDFVELVQSPERLRLLLILTVVDIRAVAPDVWNGWKATLLRELYYRTLEEMTGGSPVGRQEARAEEARTLLAGRLAELGWEQTEIDAHMPLGYTRYWLLHDIDTHIRHAELIRKAKGAGESLIIETRVDPDRDITEVVIYAPDHAGLFSQIAGGISLGQASIVDAKIITLSNGMALDTLSVQDATGHALKDSDALTRMRQRISDSISGRVWPRREIEAHRREAMPSRTRVFTVPPHVTIDNNASRHHTVIEIQGRDRIGFLHDVTSMLTALNLQIYSAHITTYGERAIDVFYVRDIFGLKVHSEDKLKEIEKRLLEAITAAGPDDAVAGVVAA